MKSLSFHCLLKPILNSLYKKKKEDNYQNLVTHYPGKAIFSNSRGFKIKIFPWRVGLNHGGASYVTNLKCPF